MHSLHARGGILGNCRGPPPACIRYTHGPAQWRAHTEEAALRRGRSPSSTTSRASVAGLLDRIERERGVPTARDGGPSTHTRSGSSVSGRVSPARARSRSGHFFAHVCTRRTRDRVPAAGHQFRPLAPLCLTFSRLHFSACASPACLRNLCAPPPARAAPRRLRAAACRLRRLRPRPPPARRWRP